MWVFLFARLRTWLLLAIALPLARLLVHPALQHPDIADIGAEHDVEGVAALLGDPV